MNITIPTEFNLDNALIEVMKHQELVMRAIRTPIIASLILLHIALLLFVFRNTLALKFGDYQQQAYEWIGSIVMWFIIIPIMWLMTILFMKFELIQ